MPEAFADRRYNPDGTLQSRAFVGSLLTDPAEAAAQVMRIVEEGAVIAHDGTAVPVQAASICFPRRHAGAPRIVAAARERLASAGVTVCPIPALLSDPVA